MSGGKSQWGVVTPTRATNTGGRLKPEIFHQRLVISEILQDKDIVTMEGLCMITISSNLG